MLLDKFVKCNCGKKKKITWVSKDKYARGEVTFCAGITKCSRCGIVQQHYAGNIEDIQKFINEFNGLND